jgi:hypothetical protein
MGEPISEVQIKTESAIAFGVLIIVVVEEIRQGILILVEGSVALRWAPNEKIRGADRGPWPTLAGSAIIESDLAATRIGGLHDVHQFVAAASE